MIVINKGNNNNNNDNNLDCFKWRSSTDSITACPMIGKCVAEVLYPEAHICFENGFWPKGI